MSEIQLDETLQKQALAEIKEWILRVNKVTEEWPVEARSVAEELACEALERSLAQARKTYQVHQAAPNIFSQVPREGVVDLEKIRSRLTQDAVITFNRKNAATRKQIREYMVFGFMMVGITETTAKEIVDRHILEQ